MKNTIKFLGFIALVAIIGFSMTACGDSDNDSDCAHSFSKVITPGYETDTCSKCGETGQKTLTLEVGDTGPAGGIIYYVSVAGFTVTFDNSIAHYLEAAPADVVSAYIVWGGSTTNITGTVGSLGRGRENTARIADADEWAIAANLCIEYGKDTDFNDWFLPSTGELSEMHKLKGTLGLPATGGYWTSVQHSVDQALYVSFTGTNSSGIFISKMDTGAKVRPVRAF